MIKLRFEGRDVAALRKIYDPKVIDKALITAMNRATNKARTTASATARKIYAIPAAPIKKAHRIIRRNGSKIERVIVYRGGGQGLEKFKPGQKLVRKGKRKYKGVTVRIRKDRGRKLVGGGFKADANGVKVMARKTDARLPIRRLVGPSIPHMIAKKLVVEATAERFNAEVGIEFDKAMQHHLSKVRK